MSGSTTRRKQQEGPIPGLEALPGTGSEPSHQRAAPRPGRSWWRCGGEREREQGNTQRKRAEPARPGGVASLRSLPPGHRRPAGIKSPGRTKRITRVPGLGELEKPAARESGRTARPAGRIACSQGAYAEDEPLGFLVLRKAPGSEQCRRMNRRAGKNGQADA